MQERVALLCENVKTYHSDTGFIGGFVALNSGDISNEGSRLGLAVHSPLAKPRGPHHHLLAFFRRSRTLASARHVPAAVRDVLALCENGNEEIAYAMLWSGKAYSHEEAAAARAAKEKYAADAPLAD